MLSGLTDALKGLGVPARALLVAVFGAGLAWLWFDDKGLWAIVLVIGGILLGLVIDGIGRSAPAEHPVLKVELMEWWIIVPMVLAAFAAATAIVVTVEVTVPENSSPAAKETVAALATAITAFLASGFVDWAADDGDSKVSDRIKAHFEKEYHDTFQPNTDGELYVFAQFHGGADGWGRKARRIRAEGIKNRWSEDRVPVVV